MDINFMTAGEPVFDVDGEVIFENVTTEILDALVEAFDARYSGRDRKPPVLREHTRDGITYGRLVALRRDGDKGIAEVEPNQMPVAPGVTLDKAVELGAVQNWSPGLSFDQHAPHDARVDSIMIDELSFVAVSHLENLDLPSESPFAASRNPHVAHVRFRKNPKRSKTMADEKGKDTSENAQDEEGGAEVSLDEVLGMVESLTEEVADLKASFSQMQRDAGEEEEDEEEDGEEMSRHEDEKLELRRQIVERDIKGMDVDKERMVALHRDAPETYHDMIRLARKANATTDGDDAPEVPEGSDEPLGDGVGDGGGVDSKVVEFAREMHKAKTTGGKVGEVTARFSKKHGEEFSRISKGFSEALKEKGSLAKVAGIDG